MKTSIDTIQRSDFSANEQKAAAVTIFVTVGWMCLSLIFTYFYYYLPMRHLEIPSGLAKRPR